METPEIRLVPMTDGMFYGYFKELENDPDLFADKSKFKPYVYSEEDVARYIKRQKDLGRVNLAVMCGGEIAGEVVLKNIEPHTCATMGIMLKNASYKNRGIGTRAEKLAIEYVFRELDIPVLYADSLVSNARSRRVLEKAGFEFLREEDGFAYYAINRKGVRL